MSINTFSRFYYGFTVDNANKYIDFSEGGGELTATLSEGSYSMTDFISEVQTQLNSSGGQAYTVSVNRSTRIITISAASNFDLLITSGTNAGYGAWSLIGMTGADKTGTNSYTSDSAIGSQYSPQFKLQSFVDKEDYQESVDATINESADGTVEVVRFGTRKFFEMNIKYATNHVVDNSIILYNASGYEALQDFMQFIILKNEFEFMKDISDLDTYDKIILESTPKSSTGTGYKLNELYGQGLSGFYETGLLKMRVIE